MPSHRQGNCRLVYLLGRHLDCRRLQVLIARRSMAYTDVLRQAVIATFGLDQARNLVAAASAKRVDPKLFLEAVIKAGAPSPRAYPFDAGPVARHVSGTEHTATVPLTTFAGSHCR
jgi:hypothetical protein